MASEATKLAATDLSRQRWSLGRTELLTPAVGGERQDARWSDVLLSRVDRWRKPIFVLIGLTYLAGFNGQWQIEPDSGLYLTLGRNLALGRGYTYRGELHELVYPGFPYALAGLSRIFGTHIIVAADGLIVLCALAVLALTYRLVSLAYDRPTAVIITLGVAFSHEFYRYSYEILTEMPFLAGVMAMLAGHEAIFRRKEGDERPRWRWWDWALLVGGLAVVVSTRPTMIGLLAAWIAALLWVAARRGKWGAALVGVVTGLAALALFFWFDPRRVAGHAPSGLYERYAFVELTQDLGHRLRVDGPANLKDLFGLTAARALFGMPLGTWWLNGIMGTAVLAGGVALIGKRVLWGLWVIFTILMLVLLISHDRYILQVLPLLVLGWWQILRRMNLRMRGRTGNYIFGLLLLLGVAPNTIQVIGLILRQHTEPFLAYYKEGRFPAFVEMAGDLPKFTEPRDVVLCPLKYSRALTFLSDRYVYEPDEPFAAEPNHLFVIYDPADRDYVDWLAEQQIVVDSKPLVWIGRPKGQPGIWLAHAHRGTE